MTESVSACYGQPLHDADCEHVARLGPISVRVDTTGQRVVLTRYQNGTANSVGMPASDIAAALTLLQTAADWLAG